MESFASIHHASEYQTWISWVWLILTVKICNVNIFCQHLTPAKQLVSAKTNKEGWKQSIVLHSLWETYETFVVWIRIYCVWSNKSCNSEFSSNCYSLDRQALNMQAFYMWVHLFLIKALTFTTSVFVPQFLTFLNNWRLQGHDKGINKICVQMSERYKWLKMSQWTLYLS